LQLPQFLGSLFVSTHFDGEPHDFPHTPELVQQPLQVEDEQPPPPESVGVASEVLPPSPVGESGANPSSAASSDPSSPESGPTTSSALSGTVPSSPVEVSGFG
jgi:hypothetical protein